MVTVSRTGLTPDHVEMLIILKDNRGRIEEFKMITSYDIKTKKLVMRDTVEVIRETVPATEGSALFGDKEEEDLDGQDFSSDSSDDDNSDIEALMDLEDLV